MCQMVSIIAKPLGVRVILLEHKFVHSDCSLPALFGDALRRYGAKRGVEAFTHIVCQGSLLQTASASSTRGLADTT